MISINKTTLLGNCTKDVEVRAMNNGDQVASFTVATDDSYKKNGEWVDRADFHNIVCFNQHLIKYLQNNVRKGTRVFVEGKGQTRSYEKNGEKKYMHEIVLQKFDGVIKAENKKSGGGEQSPDPARQDPLDGDFVPF